MIRNIRPPIKPEGGLSLTKLFRYYPPRSVGGGFFSQGRRLECLIEFSHSRLNQDLHFFGVKINTLLFQKRFGGFQCLGQLVRAMEGIFHTCSTNSMASRAIERFVSSLTYFVASCLMA